MLAFDGSEEIKNKYLARVRQHRELDNIIQGAGWDKKTGKGCAVGCTLENYSHIAYETELGIPRWLAFVEDTLFERMSVEDSKLWPEQFLAAVPVGTDLDKIKGRFLVYVLQIALEQFDHTKFPECKEAIDEVIYLYTSGETDLEKFKDARVKAAAYAAAADAAYAAYAADYAAYAAYAANAAAAAHAADAAVNAADAAAEAAAAADARETTAKRIADGLLELMRNCEAGK